jgi:hypothetical protein
VLLSHLDARGLNHRVILPVLGTCGRPSPDEDNRYYNRVKVEPQTFTLVEDSIRPLYSGQ